MNIDLAQDLREAVADLSAKPGRLDPTRNELLQDMAVALIQHQSGQLVADRSARLLLKRYRVSLAETVSQTPAPASTRTARRPATLR